MRYFGGSVTEEEIEEIERKRAEVEEKYPKCPGCGLRFGINGTHECHGLKECECGEDCTQDLLKLALLLFKSLIVLVVIILAINWIMTEL